MRHAPRPTHVLATLLALTALVGCGGEGWVDGSVMVYPGKTTVLRIDGTAETTLTVTLRSAQPVVMIDGAAEVRLAEGAGIDFEFTGTKELWFRSEGDASARVHYRGTSRDGVSSFMELR